MIGKGSPIFPLQKMYFCAIIAKKATMPNATIAIGQFSAVHLQLTESIEKLEHIMTNAAKAGAQLLVMGETWLSGYPAWLDHCPDVAQWNNAAMKEVFFKLHQSSVSVPSAEFETICRLVKNNSIALCLGINEKVASGPGQGTIYNSVLTIDSRGQLQNHHRKLMPTYTEKMLYGMGDGAGLKSVELPFGKLTASVCWEHWMPLSRQALHNAGEHVHVALWPTVHEMHQVASRHYAFEGRCFVVAAGQLMKASDFPTELKLPENLSANPHQWVLRGGSCVIDPEGKYIVQPVIDREELILCTIDTDHATKERMTLDTSGHYQRKDVFTLLVDTQR